MIARNHEDFEDAYRDQPLKCTDIVDVKMFEMRQNNERPPTMGPARILYINYNPCYKRRSVAALVSR